MQKFLIALLLSISASGFLTSSVVAASLVDISGANNKASMVRGSAYTTAASATVILASHPGFKLYITGVQCKNTSASSSGFVTLNDSASTVLIIPSNGGDNETYLTPLVVSTGMAFSFTPNAAGSAIYCNAQGYFGS